MNRYLALTMLLAFCAGLWSGLREEARELFNDSSLSDAALHARLSEFDGYGDNLPADEVLRFTHAINDTLEAPFFLVVPEAYRGEDDWPLMVWLHGGVMTREFYLDFEDELAAGQDPMQVADSLGRYIHLYPLARYDCAWWDPPALDNILWQIRFVKDRLRVDDNRVYVSGSSDGGTGSSFLGQMRPDDFAALMPHIGMVSVGAAVTGRAAYAVNLRNRPVRAVNCEFDGLYPARSTNTQIGAMRRAGVDIACATYGSGHDMDYWPDDMVAHQYFAATRVRDPFNARRTWECDRRALPSGVDWLVVTRLDTTVAARPWHTVVQDSLVDDRISFGFYPTRNAQGEGIPVDSLVTGESPARAAGLQPRDRIVAMNDVPLRALGDMDSLKQHVARGDDFTLTVERDGATLVLEGAFPPPDRTPAFFYDNEPSGRLVARYEDNHFMLETSRVAAVELRLHPAMVDFDRPVTVSANGEVIWEGPVDYDRRYMQRTFEDNLDRAALWATSINVSIPPQLH